jgi:AraC-like DNA-binding protein
MKEIEKATENQAFDTAGPVLLIKHMVCPRCIYIVKTELEQLQISFSAIRLGEVELSRPVTETELAQVKVSLEKFGFELIQDQKSKIIEQVKTLVLQMIRYQKSPGPLKHSEYLAKETGKEYSQLSNLFSGAGHITIEKYIILQRIEYVKELLTYDELSLCQIANELSYSNVGYLSRQFKMITGMTPSAYKKLKVNNRKALDALT